MADCYREMPEKLIAPRSHLCTQRHHPPAVGAQIQPIESAERRPGALCGQPLPPASCQLVWKTFIMQGFSCKQ